MLPNNEAPANFVPAAAVTRRGQVLFVMTGRMGYVGCLSYLIVKSDENKASKTSC